MARPSTQKERRAQIRTAAARTILVSGTQAPIRLTDVAKEAGMTSASLLYYYKDVDDLLIDVQRHALERYSSEIRAAADAYEDPRDQLIAMLRFELPSGRDDQEYALFYANALPIRGSARSIMSCTIFDRTVAEYERVLLRGAELEVFRLATTAREIARSLAALEDGLGRYILIDHPDLDVEAMYAMLLQTASALTSTDLLAHAAHAAHDEAETVR